MKPSRSSRPTISWTVGAESCIARATLAPVIGRPASWSQKIVWRYSSSATVAWSDAMRAILVRRRPAAAESLHALGGERHERARGGREMGVAAGDGTGRGQHRRVDGRGGETPGEPAPERDAAGADGVAEPAGGEVEGGLDVLHLDLGLE